MDYFFGKEMNYSGKIGGRMCHNFLSPICNHDVTMPYIGTLCRGTTVLSGARMDLTTEAEHPTSVVLGEWAAALPQCNQEKNEKPPKAISGKI